MIVYIDADEQLDKEDPDGEQKVLKVECKHGYYIDVQIWILIYIKTVIETTIILLVKGCYIILP